jgi:hypothetical protein
MSWDGVLIVLSTLSTGVLIADIEKLVVNWAIRLRAALNVDSE